MKTLKFISGTILSLTISVVNADVELSNLIQWEESQIGQVAAVSGELNEEAINNINSLEATAAGQEQFSNLVQWEESQYAQPYRVVSNVDDINKLEPTAAGIGQEELSNLIQWEESF